MKSIDFKGYVNEILKEAEYKKDLEIDCVVGIASILPGCMTQGSNFEEARDNLKDAIELWVKVGLREGDEMPLVNGLKLASQAEELEQAPVQGRAAYA